MPLYDFICTSSHEFEALADVDEKKQCPECGNDTKRQFPKRGRFVWGAGAGLVDTYDRDFKEMEANGEPV